MDIIIEKAYISAGDLIKKLEKLRADAPVMVFDTSIAEMYAVIGFGKICCNDGEMPVIAFSQETNLREIYRRKNKNN